MSVELEEVEPGRWRVKKPRHRGPRSTLSLPYVISDTMPALEQVDGKFYTSKAAFRAVGRAHGLIEVGNEKLKPKTRSTDDRATKTKRREAIARAIRRSKGL